MSIYLKLDNHIFISRNAVKKTLEKEKTENKQKTTSKFKENNRNHRKQLKTTENHRNFLKCLVFDQYEEEKKNMRKSSAATGRAAPPPRPVMVLQNVLTL